MRQPLICLFGPTASGKSALAVELALRFETEIISADSMQVYRGMDIATAKPTEAEKKGVAHHMLDGLNPGVSYSVAEYVKDATPIVERLIAQGKPPIVLGGTGLYLEALVEGVSFAPQDDAVRGKYWALAEELGASKLHDLLKEVDPSGAAAIHPNNVKRVVRALEVFAITGLPFSRYNETKRRSTPAFASIKLVLCPENRDLLYRRIDARVDRMLEAGLLKEAEALYQSGVLSKTSGQAIGYKQWLPYFEGSRSIEACIEDIKAETRRYAKRQLTWLRRVRDAHWILYDEHTSFSSILQEATAFLQMAGVR